MQPLESKHISFYHLMDAMHVAQWLENLACNQNFVGSIILWKTS